MATPHKPVHFVDTHAHTGLLLVAVYASFYALLLLIEELNHIEVCINEPDVVCAVQKQCCQRTFMILGRFPGPQFQPFK